jgi:alpha-L-rhamnosidase
MVPEDFRQAVVRTLVRNINRRATIALGTGLVGAQWLMRTLSDNGQADTALKSPRKRRIPVGATLVEQGATTVGSFGTAIRQTRR